MKSRIAIIAPFFGFSGGPSRPGFMTDVFAEFGEVEIITTDFDHQTKKRIGNELSNLPNHVHMIPTLSYFSNIGIRRLLSHLLFGIQAGWFYWRRRSSFDIVYATLPLNLATWLVFLASRRKARIVDVIDIWPDVLPFPDIIKRIFSPAFWFWRILFVASVKKATVLLAVSNCFLDKARQHLIGKPTPSHMFYIGHAAWPELKVTQERRLTITYVGNIGHLCDFMTLLDALSSEEFINRMQLFVVGGGDRRDWLLNELRRRAVPHEYFGVVYDPKDLGNILGRSHIGFNGFVNTSAAFSYKATTYLSAHLPILNSMHGDLHDLVISRGIGINYQEGDVESLSQALRECTPGNLKRMSKAAEAFADTELDVYRLARQVREFIAHALRLTSA